MAVLRERGIRNFWTLGPTPEMPLLLLIIDEADVFFGLQGSQSREAKALSSELEALAKMLITKGRAAGLHVMLLTQKPTSDSLPSSVTSSCGPRLVYSVTTREAAEAALGRGSWDANAHPSPIGLLTGVAVFTDSKGGWSKVRTPVIPESVIAEHVSRHTHLARSPLQCRSE